MILVDDRERASGICDRLTALKVEHRVTHLPTADYVIDGRVLIERKTTRDFMVSLHDGRLFQQATRLRTDCRRAIMIVEGPSLPGRPGVRGALCCLAVKWYIPVLRAVDLAGTAWLLARMAAYDSYRVQPFCGYHYRAKGATLNVHERVLCEIHGIGPERARRLLERFGTAVAVLNASLPDLLAVHGIGRSAAGSLQELRLPSVTALRNGAKESGQEQ